MVTVETTVINENADRRPVVRVAAYLTNREGKVLGRSGGGRQFAAGRSARR